MRIVPFGSRDNIIEKNKSRRDFWENLEGLRNRIWYELN